MSQLKVDSVVPSGGLPAGASGGGIIQVVSTTVTSKFATNTTSYVDFTGMSVTITPASTSSKILIVANVHGSSYTNQNGFWRLVRGSTNIAIGTHSASSNKVTGAFYAGQGNNANQSVFMNICHLDSPATTSATTYKVQVAHTTTSTYLVMNSRASDDYLGAVSAITAMEISG